MSDQRIFRSGVGRIYFDREGREVDISQYVHEARDGRWVVAKRVNPGSYIANVRGSGLRGGSLQVGAAGVDGIRRSGAVASYARRSDAGRAAARQYGWE